MRLSVRLSGLVLMGTAAYLSLGAVLGVFQQRQLDYSRTAEQVRDVQEQLLLASLRNRYQAGDEGVHHEVQGHLRRAKQGLDRLADGLAPELSAQVIRLRGDILAFERNIAESAATSAEERRILSAITDERSRVYHLARSICALLEQSGLEHREVRQVWQAVLQVQAIMDRLAMVMTGELLARRNIPRYQANAELAADTQGRHLLRFHQGLAHLDNPALKAQGQQLSQSLERLASLRGAIVATVSAARGLAIGNDALQQGLTERVLALKQAVYEFIAAKTEVLRNWGLIGATLIMLLLLGVAWVLVRSITRPVRQLTAHVEHFSAGQLHTRVQDLGEGEFGALARAFNTMAEQLSVSHEQLEMRVRERTEELEELNRSLRSQVERRQRLEAKLRLAHEVLENTSEGMIVTERDGTIIDVNPAFSAITGYSREEALGHTPALLRSQRHERAFYEAIWDALDSHGQWSGEIWNRRKGGEIYPEWLSISAIPGEDGQALKYVAVFTDLTQRKEAESLIWRQANFDPLTGLPNRALFLDRVGGAVHRAHRDRMLVAVMVIDLDRFKYVNDSLGHTVGDRLLCEVGTRLQGCLRETDTVARLSGDEFIVIAGDVQNITQAEEVASKLVSRLSDPYQLGGEAVFAGGSVGIALYPQDGLDAESLLKNADTAMYRAKDLGGGRYMFFTPEMNVQVAERLAMEREMAGALLDRQFVPYFQPLIDVADGRVAGAEVLLRWQHPQRGLVPPDRFIPLAESSGFIVKLGEWVLEQALLCLQRWRQQAGALDSLSLAVNVSAVQFERQDCIDRMQALLHAHREVAGAVVLEVTESVFVRDANEVLARMEQLLTSGVRFALDDFGTGYSSLSYLKRFPVQSIKIDRAFVRDVPGDSDDCALVDAMIAMAHSLGITVVGEGVETEQQYHYLQGSGCDRIQGYLTGRPMPVAEFERMVGDGGAEIQALL